VAGVNRTVGTVRHWTASGGVIDSPDTPEGCWADPATVEGGQQLRAGQVVHLDWEQREHDRYRYTATRVEAGPALETPGA
jgi:hypothetical protein